MAVNIHNIHRVRYWNNWRRAASKCFPSPPLYAQQQLGILDFGGLEGCRVGEPRQFGARTAFSSESSESSDDQRVCPEPELRATAADEPEPEGQNGI
jgi:hypothetical protein